MQLYVFVMSLAEIKIIMLINSNGHSIFMLLMGIYDKVSNE